MVQAQYSSHSLMHSNHMTGNRVFRSKSLLFLMAMLIFVIITLLVKSSSPFHSTGSASSSSIVSSTSCKHVTVEELDQWFHSKQWNEIPKVIHQTWKTKSLRERQTRWSQTWCEQYTDWRYHLWTDDENDLFVQKKFPWFYPTYTKLSPAILRADSVRYMFMFYYGGLYIDLDYESIRSADKIFINKTVVLSLINYSFDSKNSVPNSWMASQPNHPIWTYILHRIMLLWSRASDNERTEFWNGKAEFFTGPQALFEGLMFYLHFHQYTDKSLNQLFGKEGNQESDSILEIDNITFLGPKLMNAFDWMDGRGADECSAERDTFSESKCKDIVKPIYAITYWSHSYGHGHENDANYLRSNGT